MTGTMAALAVIGLGLGLILLVTQIIPGESREGKPPSAFTRVFEKLRNRFGKRDRILVGASLLLGVVMFAITHIALFIAILPSAAIGLPLLLAKSDQSKQISKLEAIEAWARSLGGLIGSGSVGLEKAIELSLPNAAAPIREEVGKLVSRLYARWPIRAALETWAAEMDDATADIVAAQLIRTSEMRGAGLVDALEGLADTISMEVRHRLEILSDQEKPKSTARQVTLISVVAIIGFSFTGVFIDGYQSPVGQVIFGLLIVLYGVLLWWMKSMSAVKPVPRFLVNTREKKEQQHVG